MINQLMNKNWNRMSDLTRIHNKSNQERAELDFRMGIQNGFNSLTTNEVIESLEWIDERQREVKK